jgi:hypothetical protein
MSRKKDLKSSWTPGHFSADRQTIYFKIDDLYELMHHIAVTHKEPWPFSKKTFAEDMQKIGMGKITMVSIAEKLERRLAVPTKKFYHTSAPLPEDFGEDGLTAHPISWAATTAGESVKAITLSGVP